MTADLAGVVILFMISIILPEVGFCQIDSQAPLRPIVGLWECGVVFKFSVEKYAVNKGCLQTSVYCLFTVCLLRWPWALPFVNRGCLQTFVYCLLTVCLQDIL